MAAAALTLALAGLAAPVAAGDWETADTVLLTSALAATSIDWAQSRYIAKHPGDYAERNPILGRHPSTGAVNRYFGAVMLATVGLAAVLPVTQRRWMLGGLVVVETVVIIGNQRIGIRASF